MFAKQESMNWSRITFGRQRHLLWTSSWQAEGQRRKEQWPPNSGWRSITQCVEQPNNCHSGQSAQSVNALPVQQSEQKLDSLPAESKLVPAVGAAWTITFISLPGLGFCDPGASLGQGSMESQCQGQQLS